MVELFILNIYLHIFFNDCSDGVTTTTLLAKKISEIALSAYDLLNFRFNLSKRN